jgi:hypothetical protein
MTTYNVQTIRYVVYYVSGSVIEQVVTVTGGFSGAQPSVTDWDASFVALFDELHTHEPIDHVDRFLTAEGVDSNPFWTP